MELRDYQKLDVQKIQANDCLGIFSEQRTGKTPTAVVGMTSKCKRILVVCPNSLVYNWAEEFHRWTGRPTTVLTKMQIPADHADIIIVNYEKLADTAKHQGLGKPLLKLKFEGLIIDEAHKIKNRNSAVAKTLIHMAHKIPKRLALTGTPAHDRPEDVYNILRFLDLVQFRSYWKFLEEWCELRDVYTPNGIVKQPVGILRTRQQEFTQMLNDMTIMHKRDEVMDWDTSQDVVDIKLPCTPAQKKYLAELEDYFDCSDGDTKVRVQGVLDRIVRYRQICNAPAIINLRGSSPKIDWILDYLKSYKDKAVLIFSNSRVFLSILETHIKEPVARIDGTVSALQRQQTVKDFQANKLRVLLIQTQAGKEGLTLDRADTTIFCDVYPPASDYMQAKDRAVPTCAEMVKPRTIFRLMMQGSFDETLYALVDNNISASDVINHFTKYLKEE